MTFNAALARRVLAYIKAHPETWDQTTWHCGTVACFAGHTALLTGWKWDEWDEHENYVVHKEARSTYVWDAASLELGITPKDHAIVSPELEVLFCDMNELEDLERIIADLEAGRTPACRWDASGDIHP